jgi:oligoribonuclease
MIWIDVETTGLNPEKDHLLEVGGIVTDDQLQEQGRVVHVVDPQLPVDELIEKSSSVVREMHTESGLWDDLRRGGHDKAGRVEAQLIVWLQGFTEGEKYPLCGSSVHFDRKWLKHYMPRLEAEMHYRNIDVSTIKELHRRFGPARDPDFEPRRAHRPLADLEDSIKALRFYLSEMGWSP